MIHLEATEDCEQIFNVVRPARLSVDSKPNTAEYGLRMPDGRSVWAWLCERDARASSQFCNTVGAHVLRRSWVQLLCDLDASNDYMI
jgi:hypothetical protein